MQATNLLPNIEVPELSPEFLQCSDNFHDEDVSVEILSQQDEPHATESDIFIKDLSPPKQLRGVPKRTSSKRIRKNKSTMNETKKARGRAPTEPTIFIE